MEIQIERALIIKPEPLGWILEGKKTWEFRTRRTNIRGWVALLVSGEAKIKGACQVVDCLGLLTVDEYIQNARKGNERKADLERQRRAIAAEFAERPPYAWVLRNVVAFPRGYSFQNPSGAVTWATLPRNVARKVEKAIIESRS